MRTGFVAICGLMLMAGCVSKSVAVRTRAAFDFSCPEQDVQVTALSSEIMSTATYGVRGCGKKASYVFTPQTGAVLNSDLVAENSGQN